jgi:hypothetical protein
MANERVHFELDHGGIREYLRGDPNLRGAIEREVLVGQEYARSIAPVHTGRYRDSIQGTVVVGRSRMIGRVGAQDQKAWWIEFGAKNNPKERVLGRALDRIAADLH